MLPSLTIFGKVFTNNFYILLTKKRASAIKLMCCFNNTFQEHVHALHRLCILRFMYDPIGYYQTIIFFNIKKPSHYAKILSETTTKSRTPTIEYEH